jgi:DnaJ-class molecular chaperone
MRDPYSVLGVARDASAADIKSAFRKLAKKWHPDRNKDEATAQARFAEASQAYEILGEEDKRRAFDRGEIDGDGKPRFTGFPGGDPRAGRGGARGNPFAGFESAFGETAGPHEFRTSSTRHGDFGGAEDILRDFFGGAGRSGPQARSQPGKPADLSIDVPISLEDLVKGDKITVQLPDGRSIALLLKPGAHDGQQMRLRGQGMPDRAGQRGDVIARLQLRKHRNFRADGSDLHGDLDVTLRQAIEGGKLPLETLDGKVAVPVPAWTGGDKSLRLRGKGLPRADGKRGDLFVHIRIVLDPLADNWIAKAYQQQAGATKPSS